MFIKTGRASGKCGKCKYFSKSESVCVHEQMNRLHVWPESVSPCGGIYYIPVDDYEKAE